MLEVATKDQAAFDKIYEGKQKPFEAVDHKAYEPVVELIKFVDELRKKKSVLTPRRDGGRRTLRTASACTRHDSPDGRRRPPPAAATQLEARCSRAYRGAVAAKRRRLCLGVR